MAESTPLPGKKLREKLKKFFETAREQTNHHNIVENAKKLYNNQDNNDAFLFEFIEVLKFCLVYPDKAAVDKMLLFVSKFAASLYSYKALIQNPEDSDEDMEHPFVNGLMTFIFQTHSAVSVDARLRCTTLINYILSAMPDESWLPVSIWNGLAEMTRSRLQDRNSGVRVAAVLIARKLQEPRDPQCEIVKLLSFHMIDPAPAVRRAVISSIALSKATIGDVIGRTLDANNNVRRNAFAVLAKVRFQSLTIAQRITLLERGLRDRVDRVRDCVESVLVAQWMDQVNKDILSLLSELDVVNCSEIVELVLAYIVKVMPMEDLLEILKLDAENNLIPLEHLSPETAILWKFLIQHISSKKLTEVLFRILPNISAFCVLLRDFYPLHENEPDEWLEVQRKNVIGHLLELALHFNLNDEMGRRNLLKQITAMLISPKINNKLVDKLIDLLHAVIPNVDNFLMSLLKIVSDIRQPLREVAETMSSDQLMQQEIELSGYRLALYDLKEKEYEAAKMKNYSEAAQFKAEIEILSQKIDSVKVPTVLRQVIESKTDPETVCKCLKILVKMIPCSKIKTLTPSLNCILEDFLMPCLESEDLITQSLAIQVLAQFCILDKTLAQKHLLSFLLMLSEDGDDEVNIPALKAVFDILQINGTQCFNKFKSLTPSENEDVNDMNKSQIGQNELSVPAEKCVAALKELMNSTSNQEMKLIAFEGFCKLLLSGVVYSPSLLQLIIIKGFSPIRGSESEDRIRQLFMVFFPLFARNSLRSQEMIEAAFLPVMRTLNDAKLGTFEGDINPRDVMNFLIDHSKPGINPSANSTMHVHNTLALAICHEVLKDAALFEDLGVDHNFLKGILLLQLSLENDSFVQELTILLAKIQNATSDAASLRIIKQINEKLKNRVIPGASIQNTLDNTSQLNGTNNTQSTFSEPMKLPLQESMGDSIKVKDAERGRGTSISRTIIPESPDISDESLAVKKRELDVRVDNQLQSVFC